MKKLISTILIGSLCLTASSLALAQQEPDRDIFDSTADFFNSTADLNNVFAPFDDFFTQNQCKRRDIFALSQERDKTGNLIRKTLLDSKLKLADVRKLQTKYQLLSAEIYYLRQVELLADPETTVNLNADTISAYDDSPAVTNAIDAWEKKYTEKLKEYDNCVSSWDDLVTAWDKFTKNRQKGWSELTKAFQETSAAALATPDIVIDQTLDTLDNFYETIKDIPDLNPFDPEASKINNGNVSLSLQLEDNGPDWFSKLDPPNSSGFQNSRAAQYLNRNPDASLFDLVDQAVNYDTNSGSVYQANLEESSIDTLAASLDGNLANTWHQATVTNGELKEINLLVNPGDEAKKSVSYTLDTVLTNQCRYGI